MAPLLTLSIERAVAGGRMLARHEGRVVLVSGAIPGERVTARLEKVSRQVAFAATVDVLEPGPSRRDPICDPACGGSVYAHIAIERQRELKAEILVDVFRRIGRLSLPNTIGVAASPESGYRLRGRLHVRDRRVGFFRERSHRLCDAGATRQFLPEVLPAVASLVDGLGSAADDCEAVLVAENVAGTQRVCHLEAGERRLVLPEGALTLPDGITGLTTRSGDRLVAHAGEGRVTDSARDLCGNDVVIPGDVSWARTAASFFQGNRYLTGALLRRVLDQAQGSRVLDLYAGVGLFTVGLAARGAAVTAVEGDATSVADMEINVNRFGGSVVVRELAVEAAVLTAGVGHFDTVVLDPPRTGVSPDALAGVVGLQAARIVYVSCDPATLARDAGRLTAQGYRLEAIEAFDLFPNTAHVETLAVFDRV